MDVQVNVNPLPNGIDIGGEAVALNCPRSAIMRNCQRSMDSATIREVLS